MTAKNKAPKIVILTDASISTAWANLCDISTKAESDIVANALTLAKVVGASKLTTPEAQQLIRASNQVSSFVSVSQVEALQVWVEMRKGAEFKALPLAKQLSTASASFSLLGVATAKALAAGKLETILSENKKARKAKVNQAKDKAKESAAKAGKKVASLPSTLADILAFFTTTDMSIYTEKQLDLVAEIHATIESKITLVDA